MGFIRGSLFVIATTLLFLSLFLGSVFWTLDSSLEYETIQEEGIPIVKDIIEEEFNLENEIEKVIPAIENYCEGNSGNYTLVQEGIEFEVPCDSVEGGSEEIINETIETFLEDVYYKEYSCGFLECIRESPLPFFLISEDAKEYWKGKFYLAILVSIGLVVLMFFLIEKKENLPLLVGTLMIISSLPFIGLGDLFGFLEDQSLFKIVTIFFTQSYSIFLRVFITGIVLILVGLIFKLLRVGFSISNLFKSFKKKETKEPVKEDKQTKVKEVKKKDKKKT